ncbi:MAG TPA: hypothetical protein DCE56_17760 [Cyanobacteria bacterium UBA8553]|nr:hypothetical protein [Cyanobacteria bacterium UBA8553]
MNGREDSLVLINGAIAPTLQTENALIRLRLLNQSPGRYYNLMLEKHSMIVIATDGGFVNTPYPVDSLLLAPGERYEVLVNFKQTGDFFLMNMPYARGRKGIDEPIEMEGMDNMQNMDMTTKSTGEGSLMTLRFTGSHRAARIPERLNSIWALNPKDTVHRRTINFTENMGMLSFSFNGKEFDPNRVDIRAKLGTVEIWELINNTDMDHPFHLHTYPFQVYARNGKPEPQPAWKDVVNVKPKETVQILIPFKDFTGKTVFHCHVLEHEERGMMGAIEIVA